MIMKTKIHSLDSRPPFMARYGVFMLLSFFAIIALMLLSFKTTGSLAAKLIQTENGRIVCETSKSNYKKLQQLGSTGLTIKNPRTGKEAKVRLLGFDTESNRFYLTVTDREMITPGGNLLLLSDQIRINLLQKLFRL
jgi:hypothetical protein